MNRKAKSGQQNQMVSLTPQNLKVPVCLFLRVSKKGGVQDYAYQETALREYCAQRGYEVTDIIATQISGARTYNAREDVQKLILHAREGKFKKVLITECSRLGRNANDVRSTISQLHSMKIPVVFKNLGGLESLDAEGNESFVTNVIVSIFAELAQEERRWIVDRIKNGLDHARKKGKQIGRPAGTVENKDAVLKKYAPIARDLKNGISLRKCVKIHGVAKGTVLKVKHLMDSSSC